MFKQFRKWLTLAVMAMAAGVVFGQDFPVRPVKILVPQTPGGASDALARIIAQKLSDKWGQPVVFENLAGAGGNVGMEVVANASPDGYTLLMSYVGTHAINGALYKKLPFDPERDFAPVATLATLPFVLVSKADSPLKTVPDVIAAAKKSQLTFGSAGNGSVNHLAGEMFNAAAGVKLTHVPYRGAAPAMQDLMGGQIDLVFTSLPSVAGAIKNGTLHPVAVTSAKRAASFSNIPTIAEAGIQGLRRQSLVRPVRAGQGARQRHPQDERGRERNRDVQGRRRQIRRAGSRALPDDTAGICRRAEGRHREMEPGRQSLRR